MGSGEEATHAGQPPRQLHPHSIPADHHSRCTLHRHHALKPRPRTRPDWATACALRCSPSGGDTARGELAEDSEDMDSDKEDRDRKSRFVLKKLKTGQIPFRRNGQPNFPFCGKGFPKDIESLIHHATEVGKGSDHKHKPASKAKHAAFGKFLRDYIKTGLIPLVGPAVGPHVLH
ncbi:hypothetical protein QYE76_006417 [Lolium multiflorum]|uniref:Uncharacterized protein n=1 Tax=Lolium multiflorum TaxID=4521 RepID=A0AAD8W268_LOLMU|nr:hypothetical protein QYE76_006417 [Lolium multiflorum]